MPSEAASAGFTVVLSVRATDTNVPPEVAATFEVSTPLERVAAGRLASGVVVELAFACNTDELLDTAKQIVWTDVF